MKVIEFLMGVLSGVSGGLLVLGVERLIHHRDKKKEEAQKAKSLEQERFVRSTVKTLPPDILDHLSISTSLDKIKEMLGTPNQAGTSTQTEFTDEPIKTNIYYFYFTNANIIITSEDNNSTDSVSIFSTDSKHPIEFQLMGAEGMGVLGVDVINLEMIQYAVNHYSNYTSRDMLCGLECYYGRMGNYAYYTYFGADFQAIQKHQESNDPQDLVGVSIYGFCISHQKGLAPYMFNY